MRISRHAFWAGLLMLSAMTSAQAEPFQVATLTGKIMVFDFPFAATTVGTVKAAIEKQEGIPVARQRFVFDGKQMADEQTLASAGLQKDSKIYLVLRLPQQSQ